MKEYLDATRTGTWGFVAAMPLLILYEVMVLMVNAGRTAEVRVGADVWIKGLMSVLGDWGMLGLSVALLVTGGWIFFRDRKKSVPLKPRWFGYLILESLLYAVVLALLVSSTVGLLFNMVQAAPVDRVTMFVLSLGAGLYEELVFRVVLVGGLFWILKRFLDRARVAYVVAALVGAFLFSAVHYVGPLGDPFSLASFTFRFLFGLALNGVFLLRGFGAAAWTHALYDVLVVTRLLG
jgi:membrane protease YdiL (CAAX protease family)